MKATLTAEQAAKLAAYADAEIERLEAIQKSLTGKLTKISDPGNPYTLAQTQTRNVEQLGRVLGELQAIHTVKGAAQPGACLLWLIAGLHKESHLSMTPVDQRRGYVDALHELFRVIADL